MTGHNYPDNLYADALDKVRAVTGKPTGAYRSTTVERVQVLPLVSNDLHKRIAKGSKDYGEPLTTNNGRDALWDAYEEALDLCLYLRQAIEERKQPSPAAQRDAKIAYDMASERSGLHELNLSAMQHHPAGIGDVPHEFASGPVRFKTLEEKQAFERECVSVFASSMASIKEQHPKWDVRWGKATHQGERLHPMNAEAIRAADEFGRDDQASGV